MKENGCVDFLMKSGSLKLQVFHCSLVHDCSAAYLPNTTGLLLSASICISLPFIQALVVSRNLFIDFLSIYHR